MASLLVNEWSLIANHIDVEDWSNFSLICKSSYFGLQKSQSLKQARKLCMKCGGRTYRHHHDENMGGDLCYELFDKFGYEGNLCLSSYEGGEIWHICFDCQVLHLECPKCETYCHLTGFPGEKSDKGKQFHIVESNGRRVFEEFPKDLDFCEIFEEGYIPIPEEWNWCFLDRKKWYFAGIDGSSHSKMKCRTCEYEEILYD